MFFTEGGYLNTSKWLRMGKEIWKQVQELRTQPRDAPHLREEDWTMMSGTLDVTTLPKGWIRRKYELALEALGTTRKEIKVGKEWDLFSKIMYDMHDLHNTLSLYEFENKLPDQVC